MSKSSKKRRPAANTPMKTKLDSSRKNRELLYSLYIASQFRSNDLTNFFSHENEMFPPKLTSEGEIQSTPQSDLIPLMLEDIETCSELPVSISAPFSRSGFGMGQLSYIY